MEHCWQENEDGNRETSRKLALLQTRNAGGLACGGVGEGGEERMDREHVQR